MENKKLEWKAQSKVGSLDNVKHKPGGGTVKIFDEKYAGRSTSEGGTRSISPSSGSNTPSGNKSSAPKPTSGKENNNNNTSDTRKATSNTGTRMTSVEEKEIKAILESEREKQKFLQQQQQNRTKIST